jgi:primosomal protein N' (replication factor Y)
VLPDVPAIDRAFDYLVPEALTDRVTMGSIVRINLHGRRVRGWVVADGLPATAGRTLRPLAAVTGSGTAPELLELAGWAAWRWAGRRVHFLRTSSPNHAVRGLPSRAPGSPLGPTTGDGAVEDVVREALALPRAVLRLPPATEALALVVEASRRGPTLVVAPSQAGAADLAERVRALGATVALVPQGWAPAAAGVQVVVGARAGAWAPVVDLAAVVVLDEHDEAHQEEASPTWSARDVVAERARRAGAACLWVSPCPSLEALRWGPLLTLSRTEERAGWPVVDVVDRRREEPLRADLYSPRLVELLRTFGHVGGRGQGPRAVCVLNRKGRAQMLVCAICAELARCEACGASVAAGEDSALICRRCATVRPLVCLACGAGRLKVLRPGVTRVREDLERLTGLPVAEVTGASSASLDLDQVPIVVGTEAVLHRGLRPRLVAFLDLDAELLAPRYRAAEQALALVVKAARHLGGKAGGGRLVLQTRLPGHEVVQAALHADPARVARAEDARREALGLPPAKALAVVSGAPAEKFVDGLAGRSDVEVLGPAAGRWLVRAADHLTLCDALASVPRPPGRLRVAVDPTRI